MTHPYVHPQDRPYVPGSADADLALRRKAEAVWLRSQTVALVGALRDCLTLLHKYQPPDDYPRVLLPVDQAVIARATDALAKWEAAQ